MNPFMASELRYSGRENPILPMKIPLSFRDRAKRWNWQSGKLGWIFLWLIGIPIPILLILFLLRGCT
jgi:hypothetical protein